MRVRAIIPCAGYGTRMGMTPDQSKELLINSITGTTFLDNYLNLCREYHLEPLIITRAEKTDLINYCAKQNIQCQIITVDGEWQSSVLKSLPHWNDKNVLLLPDTYFEPRNAMADVLTSLRMGNNAAAVHYVEDPEKWGSIFNNCIYEKKPVGNFAWGILGFNKDFGVKLFTELQNNKECKLDKTVIIQLTMFKDLTRG